ncbi:MAG: 1-deoxy-D-xylulose-5-phosphate reductoisomerase, partial [Chthoniobacterales bacterium]
MKRKRVVVLGATGSIGESARKVARDIPARMEIVGLAANSSATKLAEQANELRPEAVCIVDESKMDELRVKLNYAPQIFSGEEGLCEIARLTSAEMVLIAVVGTGGLRPALAAIEAGKDLAVASKEILVMAGEIVMNAAKEKGAHVLPVDSEHNAIFQCLEGKRPTSNVQRPTANAESSTLNVERWTLDVSDVRRLILTASGGPFRKLPSEQFDSITPEQALKHPTWNMGPKITIDSATLFNKGLEMIEARWLFNVEMARVEVVIHPQSIVHSMVEFTDGSVLAQLSHSDMCFP